MKTILIPTEQHDSMLPVLEGARLVASAFDSYMEGFAVHPFAATYVTDTVGMPFLAIHDIDSAQSRDMFECFMRVHEVPRAERPQAVYSFDWPQAELFDDSFIGRCGRVFDLIMLGRPGRGSESPRMPPLESALFDSGRPVLVIPPSPLRSLGRNVLVAWNHSAEQARTNCFALPLLQLAGEVTVLTVEGGELSGPSADEAARRLRRNGIKATALTVAPGPRTRGEVILEKAASLGCDFLVKGAYTESRFRQMIFGGTTRHILAHATLPVFMAH